MRKDDQKMERESWKVGKLEKGDREEKELKNKENRTTKEKHAGYRQR